MLCTIFPQRIVKVPLNNLTFILPFFWQIAANVFFEGLKHKKVSKTGKASLVKALSYLFEFTNEKYNYFTNRAEFKSAAHKIAFNVINDQCLSVKSILLLNCFNLLICYIDFRHKIS
ncbi:hypothetical protein RO04_09370 [Aggregatibacter actinomycetemcomitans]|nr:hypothetical protein RO04_09370 [Aggregatibacter actinomycetemcomitans]